MKTVTLQKVYTVVLALLVALFPFSKALPNILLPLLVVLFVADVRNVDFSKLKQPIVYALYTVMGYLFIKGAIRGSLFSEFSVYSKYITILVMPVLFAKVTDYLLIKKVLLAGIVATVVVSIIKSLIYYAAHGNFPFNIGLEVNEILILERPYAGFYAVAGTLLSLYLIPKMPRYRWLLVAAAGLCVFFIVFIAARMSLISLVICLGIYIMFYARMKLFVRLLMAFAGLVLVSGAVFLNKNLYNRLFVDQTMDTTLDYEPRVVIWQCAYDLLHNPDYNPVFGFPSNKVLENEYVDCFSGKITNNETKRAWFIKVKFNSHNQFHDYMLAHGFAGLLLLAGFMLMLLYHVRRNFVYFSIVLSLIFFMAVENIFFRQMGCYIFSIFIALLLINNNQIIDEEDQSSSYPFFFKRG